MKGVKAATIQRIAEKKLLNIRISQCHFTVSQLQNEKEALETNLRTKLTEQKREMVELTLFIYHAHDAIFRKTRERQQRKYYQLSRKRQQTGHSMHSGQRDDPANITERWVVNLADRQLDRGVVSLMKKRLNVTVTPQSLPVDDLVTETEMVCKNINEKHRADGFRSEVAKAVIKHRSRHNRPHVSQ